jgi:hypothetical protein
LVEDATDKKTEDIPEVEITAKEVEPTNGGDRAAKDDAEVEIEDSGNGVEAKPATDSRPSYDRRPSGDGGGRGGGSYYSDRSRPMSDDEKLKRYKKQSEERLLDIKRSREAKIGKRRGR